MMRLPLDRLPITARVALSSAALMIVLGLLASQQVLSTLERQQDTRLRELARLHVGGLSVALAPAALRRDVWEVYDTLDRARAASDGQRMVFTVVADDTGRVLAATDPARAPVDSTIEPFLAGALSLGSVTSGEGASVVRVAEPLEVQGRQVGMIVAEMDVGDLLAERRQASATLLVANALGTLLLAAFGYWIVSRQLKSVTLLAERMGDIDGVPRTIGLDEVPRADREVMRLVGSYNRMAGAVAARVDAERRLADRERFVSLGRLSSSLAHEINNPIGGLLNLVDTIRSFPGRTDVVRESVDMLDRGLRHLRDVSRAILDENRIDRSGQPLAMRDFEDLRLLFEPEAQRKGQSLSWRVSGEDLWFGLHAAAPVRQITLNLLLNASEASSQNGEVGLEADARADRLLIRVIDDGPGLGDRHLARLLSNDPVDPGGGVGLRLVRDLVQGLAGRIEHHRDGGHTEIVVSLPVGRVSDV